MSDTWPLIRPANVTDLQSAFNLMSERIDYNLPEDAPWL